MCLPSVTGDGLLPLALRCLPLTPGPPLVVFQTVLPDRSTASVVFLPASWDVRMICPFQMIGVEVPLPGSLIFHATFLVALQLTGYVPLGATPLSVGPRQLGQLSAETVEVTRNSSPKTIARILIENSIG